MVPLERALIRTVVIYKGHEETPLNGPYFDHIPKQIAMFEQMNRYRKEWGRPEWRVIAIRGEDLIAALNHYDPNETLLVIPAGPSSSLEKAFSREQLAYIKEEFLEKQGGRLYATCGASYMVSKTREYKRSSSEKLEAVESTISLFEGVAKGPLCPYQAQQCKVDFYTEAVTVTGGEDFCTVYLSGGGSFCLDPEDQNVKVLVTYPDTELIRLKKTIEESKLLQNAAVLTQIGKGCALLAMFHPYYGSEDIDVHACVKAFADSGTNWQSIQKRLSPVDARIQFVFKHMLSPLEDPFEKKGSVWQYDGY